MRVVVLLPLLHLIAACGSDETAAPAVENQSARVNMQQWSLPRRLDEISGLALTSDERLLAVTDEIAVVYEIDYLAGGLVKAFAFGNPPVRGDFEGIAVRDGTVWLMTSGGELFAGPEGADGENVDYENFNTGLGDTCELEGLSADHDGQSLILICKEEREARDLQMVYWHPNTEAQRSVALPENEIEDAADRKKVNPSGIAPRPGTDNFLVVAARQHLVFELSAEGGFSDVIMRLDENRHRQAEGIAVTKDGRMLIADEAGGGSARLAVYRLGHGE